MVLKHLLAGAEGFEPPLAVLETAGLPLNLRPCVGHIASAIPAVESNLAAGDSL